MSAAVRHIGARELKERLGLSDATVWRWCRDGRLPRPHYLGMRRAWLLSEIEEWEREQLLRTPPPAPPRAGAAPAPENCGDAGGCTP